MDRQSAPNLLCAACCKFVILNLFPDCILKVGVGYPLTYLLALSQGKRGGILFSGFGVD